MVSRSMRVSLVSATPARYRRLRMPPGPDGFVVTSGPRQPIADHKVAGRPYRNPLATDG
jgi:hypothetical protein